MFNRIYKQRKSSSVFKKVLLLKVIVRSKKILICKNYFKRGLRSYMVYLLDSTWYVEYIRLNCSRYNVLSLIVAQLEVLSSTYVRLKTELKDIFEKQM